MKKTIKRNRRVLLGIGSVLSVLLLTSTAFAAAGQVSFNQVAVRLFGDTIVEAGESFRASNGQEVPSVITYTDAAGGKTNYVSLSRMSDLLDMEVAWNAEKNSVDIATRDKVDGTPSVIINVNGPADTLEVTAPDPDEVEVIEGLPTYPDKPENGVTHGAFTEIDPATVDTSGEPTCIYLRNTRIQADLIGFPTMMYDFIPQTGKYIVYEIKNNGPTEQVVSVARQPTITADFREQFSKVSLAPGATLTRAFSISEDYANRLGHNLLFDVTPAEFFGAETDVTVSLWQYN